MSIQSLHQQIISTLWSRLAFHQCQLTLCRAMRTLIISDPKKRMWVFKICTSCSYFFLSAFHYNLTFFLFDVEREGQIYSMLISPVHAQSKSSFHSDDLKSSSHTDWSNFPLHFLLPLHASCKCDNVLCSEIHTISVHLAPNVSKKSLCPFLDEWPVWWRVAYCKSGPW